MKTLVLCPPIVIKNWVSEWAAASKFKPENLCAVIGTGKKRAELFKKSNKAFVMVTNYETLLMPDAFEAMKAWAPEIVIYDESHKIKSYNAKRSKKAFELSRQISVKNRYILTGTPVLNSPMDLFQQFLVMDLGKTFGHNFFVFRSQYFVDRNSGMPSAKYFPDWRIRQGSIEEIKTKISDNSVYIEKSKCLDLPDLVKIVVKVEMTPAQRRVYQELAKDFISFVGSRACVAKTALTKALRLMQVASGFVSLESAEDDDGNDIGGKTENEFENNPKDDALRELLDNLSQSGKTIVWASFRKNYASIRQVCEGLNLPYVQIHGSISTKDKFEAVERFNTDDKVKVLIGHPGAGGVGINLIAAKYSVYYSRTFSLEHDIQSEARNYRGGSEIHDKITRYDLVTEDTIDELVATRLALKQALSDSIIMDLALEMK